MKRFPFVCVFIAVSFAVSAYELEIGAGTEVRKRAYKKYDTEWFASPTVDFENDFMYISDFAVGAKLINLKDDDKPPFFMFSVFSAWDDFAFRPRHSSDPQLKVLRTRRDSMIAGVKTGGITPYGAFEIPVSYDILGRSNGFYGRAGYYLSWDTGPVEFIPGIGLNWADTRYNRYYFGILPSEAHASGLPEYRPKASVSPFTQLAVFIPLGKHWELASKFEIALVPDTLQDSPMVSRSTTYTFSVGINYIFR